MPAAFSSVEGAEVAWTEEQLSRWAIKEFVDALESENPPTNPERKPKAMSPPDPAAAWTTRGRVPGEFLLCLQIALIS